MVSSNLRLASSMGMFNLWNSPHWKPRPTPKSNLPSLIRSTVAACSASWMGLWKGITVTPVPKRIFSVTPAK